LKTGIVIGLFVISLALFAISTYILTTHNQSGPNMQKQIPIQNSNTPDTSLIVKYQEVKMPDYVPPKNGGNNKIWCGNRHRFLLKDRECYFGNGMRNRYRWGQKWQDKKTK